MTARLLRAALACLVLAPPASLAAQGLDELVAAGRYEDAAVSLRNASPEEPRAGAMLIFNHAYQSGFQRNRFDDAVRGFVAAKQVPRLEERYLQMLDFWHGMALYTSLQVPGGNPIPVDEAVAVLEEAEALLIGSGDYPRRANLPDIVADVEMLLEMSGRAPARD
jgi:hypothetical protein